jgi:hypothetical protein|tara:strand:+ start:2254 stop:3231 length:978 start_codon:yes stop_codon:yes gene_type:complete
MSDDKTTTVEHQPTVEDLPDSGAMDAVRAAIKQSLGDSEPSEQNAETPPVPEATEGELPQPEEPKAETDSDTNNDYSWRKRVDKLTWQKNELQREIEDLREKQFELQKQQRQPAEQSQTGISDLIQEASSFDDLERLEDQALEAERWAKKALSRYRRDPESVEGEIKNRTGQELPDDVEAWLEDLSINAEFSRESDIPKRRKQILEQTRSFEFASEKYPWLKDPQNPARAWVDQVKQANPAIKQLPEVDLYLARALVGFYVEQEQANKAKVANTTPDPTPQPGKPAAQKATLSASEEAIASAKKRVMKTGSKDGLRDFIKAAFIN